VIKRHIALAALLLGAAAPAFAQTAPPAAGPAAVAREVEAIAGIRSSSSPSFSPDGRQIAFIANASGSPQVWVMPAAGGEPRQLTRLADPVQSVHWSPAGDWLAYDVAPGGGLSVQIYVMKADATAVKRLTAGGEDNNRLAGWTDNGRYLLAASNAKFPSGFDALLIDPATGASRAVVAGKGLNGILDVSDDGRRAVVTRLVSRGDNNLYLVDLKTGGETLLTPHEGTGSFSWGEFSPDGSRLYVTSNGGRDRMAFGYVDIDRTGKPGTIRIVAERADAEAEAGYLAKNGRRAALVWNVAGRSEMQWLDTATLKLTPGPKLPFDIVGGGDYSRDGRVLAIAGSAANRPTDIYLVEVAGNRIAQRTRSAHDGVDLARLVRPELVTYQAHDGLQLSGWLYRPAGFAAPGPVVFDYHGGPEGQSRPGLNTTVQALVARGIAVFLPNVRGSSGFGKRSWCLETLTLGVIKIRVNTI
jgi:dipeptidyl aminopeptidase/acylaminoacyl peptidase